MCVRSSVCMNIMEFAHTLSCSGSSSRKTPPPKRRSFSARQTKKKQWPSGLDHHYHSFVLCCKPSHPTTAPLSANDGSIDGTHTPLSHSDVARAPRGKQKLTRARAFLCASTAVFPFVVCESVSEAFTVATRRTHIHRVAS